MTEAIQQLLKTHKLRKTNIRQQVLQVLMDAGNVALSHNAIEKQLEKVDRITLYRTLKTFEQKGLIHQAVDSSGTAKYAMCSNGCSEHAHQDDHAHFYCLECGKTECLSTVPTPKLSVPAGYEVVEAHIVFSGKCKACAK